MTARAPRRTRRLGIHRRHAREAKMRAKITEANSSCQFGPRTHVALQGGSGYSSPPCHRRLSSPANCPRCRRSMMPEVVQLQGWRRRGLPYLSFFLPLYGGRPCRDSSGSSLPASHNASFAGSSVPVAGTSAAGSWRLHTPPPPPTLSTSSTLHFSGGHG